ncbi:MAG: hypothetical protein ABDH25_00810 [Dictyoglomaceae bacterium]
MPKYSGNKFDWEEKLISLYYTALENYIDKITLSPKLKEELGEEFEEDDFLILAEFLASLTKMFLHQQGWLYHDEEDWNFPFPSPYIH